MQYRQLGHSSLQASIIGLGTMTWGKQNTQAEAFQQMDYALSEGVNFFDTAEMYPVPADAETYTATESIIGNWLKQLGKRDQITLASKVAGPGRHLKHIRGGPKFTQEQLTQALDGSLQRLQTDVIDLYQIHWPARASNYFGKLNYQTDTNADLEQEENVIRETLVAFKQFIQQGKIRYYGLSNETPWGVMTYLRLAKELDMPLPITIQNPYSLLNRSFEVGLAEICHRENIKLLAYSPLAFGMLTGKYHQPSSPENARLNLFPSYQRYTGEQAKQATEKYLQIAQKHNVSPTQMALQFINQQPFLGSNLVGATQMDQLKENIESLQSPYSEEIKQDIESVFQQHSNPAP